MNNLLNTISKPLVSVIVPFYNRIELTQSAVESILSQTYQIFQIILINDGSTVSIDPLYKYNDDRINIVHQENRGPAAARNNGIKHAKGEYIAFLDSDDIFYPEKLEVQIKLHQQNPHIILSHTSYMQITENGDPIKVVNSGAFSGNVFPRILYGCIIAMPTIMIRKGGINTADLFIEKYRISEDIIFHSRIAQKSEIMGIDIPLTKVRIMSTSHMNSDLAQIESNTNVLMFVKESSILRDKKEKRNVLSHLYYNIAVSNYNNGDLLPFLLSSIKSIYHAPSKRKFIANFMYLAKMLLIRRLRKLA